MIYHSATITTLAFNEDNTFLASGGLDGRVYLWDLTKCRKKNDIKGCHRGSVNGILYIKHDEVITVGEDAFLKIHKVKL